MNIDAIRKAAERYNKGFLIVDRSDKHIVGFMRGALSKAAKEYWFEIFIAEQKKAAQIPL